MADLFEANIIRPIIAEYTNESLQDIPSNHVELIRGSGFRNVIDEQLVATIKSTGIERLKEEIINLCLKYQPSPILVKLKGSVLYRTFITSHPFSYQDPSAILETIHYSLDAKGRSIQEFMDSKFRECNQRNHALLSENNKDWAYYGNTVRKIRGEQSFLDINDKQQEYLQHIEKSERALIEEMLKNESNCFNEIKSFLKESLGISIADSSKLPPPIPYSFNPRAVEHTLPDLNTILYDFIEERGRILQTNSEDPKIDRVMWFKRWHPEMLEQDVNIVSNTTL